MATNSAAISAGTGLVSGINYSQLISQLTAVDEQPVTQMQTQQQDYQLQIAALSTFSTNLSTFKSALDTLNSAAQFNTKTASVTTGTGGASLLTVSASSSAVVGSHSIQVNQLAAANTIASQGWSDQNTTAIAPSGGTFSFKVGGGGALTTISVGTTMTLQGLRDAINSAGAGVTASIMNTGIGTTTYRLVLTANSTGSANPISITTNGTDLDFADKKIGSVFAYSTNSYSGTVTNNAGNYYTGSANKSFLAKITTAGAPGTAQYEYSTDGGVTWSSPLTTSTLSNTASQYVIDTTNNKVSFTDGTNTYNINLTTGTYSADQVASDLQTQMNNAIEAEGGTADISVSYDPAAGKFTISNGNAAKNYTMNWSDTVNSTAAGILGFNTVNKTITGVGTSTGDFVGGMFLDNAGVANSTNGNAKIIFGTTGTLAAGDMFSIDVYNPQMQAAQDAVINVDGATITKSSNTITDAIQGVTMNLLKTDTAAVTLSVSSDTSSAQTNIQSFVSAYNTLIQYINQQTTYDPSQNTSGSDINQTNPLLSDPAMLLIKNNITRAVTGAVPGIANSQYSGLSQIGFSTDSSTGELSLDSSQLSTALNTNPSAVANLFISTATPSNSAVSYVSDTATTQPGTYGVYVTTAPKQASLSGDEDLSLNGLTNQETLTFEYTNNKTAATPNYTNFGVTLAQGSTINTIVNTLNSAFATNNVGLTASNVNGKLSITSANYGADSWFQVSSNQMGGGGNYQIWDSNTATTPVQSAGVDIAGTINNHPAKGVGDVLTSSSGFAESGLAIKVDTTQTGGFGTMAVSSGIASSVSSSIALYTDPTTGMIVTESNSKQTDINNLTTQEDAINTRISQETQSLQAQFAQLETLLAQYKTQSDTITSMFSTLTSGWAQDSGGTL